MSILVGRGDIYDIEECKKKSNYHVKMTVSIIKITNNLAQVLKDLGLKVKRPLKKNLKICRSLWVRDQSICINNKIYFFTDKSPAPEPSSLAIKTIPYKGQLVNENIKIDGGDIIQDGNTIFIGQGIRSDKSAVRWLEKTFPDRNVIPIVHKALHLDCCFSVMPGNNILYSTQYIPSFPKSLKKKYHIKKVEDLIGKSVDANLATNNLIVGDTIITTNQVKFKSVRSYLRSLGFNVIELTYSTLWRHGGGPRCLTQWIKLPSEQNIL